MVRLFKKSGKKHTTTFKFNASLHLKKLELEEYAHVIHAFHKGLTELNHFLKESLLEGYISFDTFNRITKELKLEKFRNSKIPNVPSIKTLFYSKAVELRPSEPDISSMPDQIQSEVPRQEVISGPPPSELAPKSPPKSPPKSAPPLPTGAPTPPPPLPSGSPTIPKVTFSQPTTISILGSSEPQRESDRATGIAILRKQMSEELKKIRTSLPNE